MTHKIPCFEKNVFPMDAVQLLYWHALTQLPISPLGLQNDGSNLQN
jgi:hypothetical protein